ncbi:helix-turn-helix transcriptional regulator [Paenibacillus sp. FSL R7-0331]|uniref:helix-turn-helix transcriptional regulator n=1 Tax=Paenibacillus sp. FSL R7-0331 TaxID=1536773 RepID=UPI0004F5BD67|nr:WYL domain-containing protein [Paenibacillus sp. FSL R7-0331]AIQ50727.1 transcriptional regulator [Paenibacillus sp. FSL R7-0331]
MARESFDKEIQFLRMLVLTSGAYSRQQFAERLGISVHTFDKTVKKLKEVVQTIQVELPEDQDKAFIDTFRFNYYDSAEPALLFLFRAKSLKESESLRLSRILAGLNEQPLTIKELLEVCCSGEEQEEIWPDEKTLRGDLKYLEEVGVIAKQPGPRPYRYRLYDDLIRQLSDDELCELFDFVDVMANTQVPSVQGYLLRDSLKKQLNRRSLANAAADPFLYKYHYYSRILDEAHLYPLLSAIRERRKVQFLYFSPKEGKNYSARPTNPLFERETEGRLENMLPLKIVYDHQYGRWYLLASDKRKGVRKYRLEGITQIAEAEAVAEELFQAEKKRLDGMLSLSWMIDTGNPVTIRAKFLNPVAGGGNNFVKERVLQQGQWGVITGEDEHSFIYEINVNGYTEIKPWLRSFGSSCEILEPLQLRQEMIQEWKELLAYYESV